MAYVSEHTKFINQWLQQNPQEKQVQQSGRALWWDRPPRNEEELRRREAAQAPRKAYYYDVN
ncbi:DUF3460 family protein [bacterium]|nr:DUF3460 family protein [bacterium]